MFDFHCNGCGASGQHEIFCVQCGTRLNVKASLVEPDHGFKRADPAPHMCEHKTPYSKTCYTCMSNKQDHPASSALNYQASANERYRNTGMVDEPCVAAGQTKPVIINDTRPSTEAQTALLTWYSLKAGGYCWQVMPQHDIQVWLDDLAKRSHDVIAVDVFYFTTRRRFVINRRTVIEEQPIG